MPGRVLFTLTQWGRMTEAPSVHLVTGQCGHGSDPTKRRRVQLQFPQQDASPRYSGMVFIVQSPHGSASHGPGAILTLAPGEAAHLVGLGCASYVDE
jgi:hypothetical protein